jgi:small subunit ribosomal protein S20
VSNHPSAEKRNRQRIVRTARNRSVSSAVRTQVKRVRDALAEKNKEAAAKTLSVAISALDKASSKGVVHPKAASRTISRLAAQVAKLAAGKDEPAPVAKAGAKTKAAPKAKAKPAAKPAAAAKK